MAGELILVVDDQELIVRQAEAALRLAGYRTATASNARDALQAIENNPPDLLLSDIRMPDLDGLQLFSRGRKVRPELVGIFMTAHSSIDIVVRAIQLGISGFLIKPFTGSELESAIEDALEKSRASQEATRMRVLAPLFEALRYVKDDIDLAALGRSLVEVVARETKSDYCAIFVPENFRVEKPESSLKAIASHVGANAEAFAPQAFPAVRVAARTLEVCRTLSLRRTSDQLPNAPGAVMPGAIIGVPFLSGGHALGAMLVGRVEIGQLFTPGERELFEVLAAQLATLLENQQLRAALAERDERLRLFAGRFVAAHESENRKRAERIQAEVLPALTAARQHVQAYLQKARPASAQDLLQTESGLQTLINNVKKLIQELRPSNLDEFGLSAALRQHVRDRQENSQAKCHPTFRLEGEEAPRVDSAVETALFRAAVDALDSASQHTAASQIEVLMRVSGPRNKPNLIEIMVSDNGEGFDLTALAAGYSSARLGLMAIQERVTLAGGDCQIKSAPGQGTTVTISYHIPEEVHKIPVP
jgi:signal transduction histidine kinase